MLESLAVFLLALLVAGGTNISYTRTMLVFD